MIVERRQGAGYPVGITPFPKSEELPGRLKDRDAYRRQ